MNPHAMRRRTLLGSALLTPLTRPSWAQSYPSRPITLVVPSAPGGGTDITARAIGQEISKRLGQSVVIENLSGASGGIGAAKVARAAPDGHTLLVANSDVVLAPLVHKNAGYRLADLMPIAKVTSAAQSLIARPGLPASNVEQLIALAKAQPGRITVGVSGLATLPALAVSMFEDAAQIDLLKVPYKGAAQVMTDLLGGQLDLAVTAIVNSLGPVRAGQAKMIGVMSPERLAIAPEFPRFSETAATRQVSIDIWLGIFGPSALPAPIAAQINAAVRSVLGDPAYLASRAKTGEVVARPESAEEFGRFVAAESVRYREAARRLPMDP